MTRQVRNLLLILGDQLSPDISSLGEADLDRDIVVMAEVLEEATYVKHHKKKIAFLFSAMRHFADELRGLGWCVDYRCLDDEQNGGSFTAEIKRAVAEYRPERVIVTEPGEWRVLEAMKAWSGLLGIPVDVLRDDRFICSGEEFAFWASDRKQLRWSTTIATCAARPAC